VCSVCATVYTRVYMHVSMYVCRVYIRVFIYVYACMCMSVTNITHERKVKMIISM